MHWLTLAFIYLDLLFFFAQVYDIFRWPHETRQWWYLLLLALLIGFNLANGVLPDPGLKLNLKLQYILADGSAYLLGAYLPYYFYKVFELKTLRLYVTWGVLVFELAPFALFNILLYGLNGQLAVDRRFTVLIPAAYGLVLLRAMYVAARKEYLESEDRLSYIEQLLVWAAILPWEVMSVFAFYPVPQWVQVLSGNLGWVAITFFMIVRTVQRERLAYRRRREPHLSPEKQAVFVANCRKQGLSRRETDIAPLMCRGLKNREIADQLFIALRTVNKHVQHIYQKTGAANRIELLRLLEREEE